MGIHVSGIPSLVAGVPGCSWHLEVTTVGDISFLWDRCWSGFLVPGASWESSSLRNNLDGALVGQRPDRKKSNFAFCKNSAFSQLALWNVNWSDEAQESIRESEQICRPGFRLWDFPLKRRLTWEEVDEPQVGTHQTVHRYLRMY